MPSHCGLIPPCNFGELTKHGATFEFPYTCIHEKLYTAYFCLLKDPRDE